MDDAIMADTQGIDPELVNALIELGREKGDQRIAALEAELAPWREMERQVEALRGEGWVVFLLDHDLTSDGKYHGYVLASDRPFPDAVNAAYGKVVGDE